MPGPPPSGFTFTSLGNANNTTGATLVLTLTTPIRVGDWVAVPVFENTVTLDTPTIIDSRGNSYNVGNIAIGGSGNNGMLSLGTALVTTALQVGDTITYEKITSGVATLMSAGFLTGALADPLFGTDDGGTANNTNASPSCTSFGPTYFGEYYLAAIYYAGSPTYTAPSGSFTITALPLAQISGSNLLGVSQINNSLLAEKYNPTLSTSEPWGIIMTAFVPAFSAYIQGTDNSTDRMIVDQMRPIMVPGR